MEFAPITVKCGLAPIHLCWYTRAAETEPPTGTRERNTATLFWRPAVQVSAGLVLPRL